MKIRIECSDLDIYNDIIEEFKDDTVAVYDNTLNTIQFMGRKIIMREMFYAGQKYPIWTIPEYGPVIPVNMIDTRIVSSVLNVIKELEVLCLC
jgi:hypothetical protein